MHVKAVLCIVSWCASRYGPVSKWISESLKDRSSICEWVAGVRYRPIQDVYGTQIVVHPCEPKNQCAGRRTGCMCI